MATTSTASKIYANGLYQINGAFDEVTYNSNSGVITNTVAYSQNFTASGISTSGVYVSLTTATVAPDGTYTAWKMTKAFTTVSSQAYLNVPTGVSGRYNSVYSLYVKPAEYSTFAFSYNTAGYVTFNLTLTQVVSINTGPIVSPGTGGFVSGSITTASNGWYRLSATTINEAISPIQLFISSSGFIGNDVNGVYIWGLQSEVSSASSPSIYVPKVNNVIASPPGVKNVAPGNVYTSGVLDEVTYNPSYAYTTNFIPNSNNIPVEWNYLVNATPITTSTLAPDGSATAVKLTSSNTSSGYVFMATSAGVYDISVPGLYTFSIYAKAAEWNMIRLSNGPVGTVNFNLSTGQLINVTANYTTGTITSVGNGWYRISGTCSSEAWGTFYVAIGTNTNFSVQSSVGGQGVYLWGPQFELGVTPTIYEATGPSGVPAPTFASRADNQGNLYSPNYYDEITSQITWTFTATSVGYGGTGLYGVQSKFTGGLVDNNYFDQYSWWGSNSQNYPSITAIFPTTYYVSTVYLGPVNSAASGGWGVGYTNGAIQSSMDFINWTTITNASFTVEGKTLSFPVNTVTNYIRLQSLNTSYWLATSEFYFDAIYYTSPYSAAPVTSNLVLYLDAKNPQSYPSTGSKWYDLSGNNFTATLVNSPSYNIGGSLQFASTLTQYGDLGTSSVFNFNSSTGFSFSMWMYNTLSSSTYQYFLDRWSYSDGNNRQWSFDNGGATTNTVEFRISSNGQDSGLSSVLYSNPSLGTQWNNYCGTYDGTTIKLYVNGVLQGTTAASAGMVSTPGEHTYIAGGDLGTSYNDTGYISVVQIYNTALTPGQVTQNFNAFRSRYGI